MKINRAKKTNEKIRNETLKQIRDEKRGCTYGPVVAMDVNSKIPVVILEKEKAKRKFKSQICEFPGCFSTKKHTSTKSKHCKYYGCNNKKKLDEAIETYLLETYPEDYKGESIFIVVMICVELFFELYFD